VARAFQFYQLCRFVSVVLAGVVLVQLGFTDDAVSSFEWFLFAVHMLSFFWAMGLKNALLSYYPKLRHNDQRLLLGSIFILLAVVSTVLGVAAVVTGLLTVEYGVYFAVFFALIVPASLSDQYLLLHQRSRTLTIYAVWVHLLYLTLIAIGALMGSLQAVLGFLLVWAVVKFCYTVILLWSEVRWRYDFVVLRPFLAFAAPLIGYILLGSGMDVLDGILVKEYFDDADFAKFRYGAKELPISALLIGALATATIPAAVSNFDSSIDNLRRRLSAMMNWLYPLSAALMITSPYLFQFFYSDQYVVSASIFNIYLLIIISRVLTPQVLLYAMHKNNVLLLVSALELMVNFVLSIALMKYYGMVGIAYATVVAYAFEKVLLTGYLRVNEGVSLSKYIDVSRYLIWSSLLGAAYITSIYLHG